MPTKKPAPENYVKRSGRKQVGLSLTPDDWDLVRRAAEIEVAKNPYARPSVAKFAEIATIEAARKIVERHGRNGEK